jgi:1,4-dihydroxy-2-naphthoyl-CoA synthase
MLTRSVPPTTGAFFSHKHFLGLSFSLFFFLLYRAMDSILEEYADKGQGTIKLDLEYQPGIALVTIDNSTRHNSLSGKMMVEFHHVVNQLEKNINKLVAVIFMGGGSPIKSFCAGLGTY